MDSTLFVILVVLASFLIGAIPTGVIVSRLIFGFDIRTKGSGNMGSTNVMRVLGTRWGLFVQIIDILKGYLPVYYFGSVLASSVLQNSFFLENIVVLKLILGFVAILGHIFSPFVGFKGGKGINTAAGMLLAISPIDFGVAFVSFWLIVFSTGYISVGSMVAGILLPISLVTRYNVFQQHPSNYLVMLVFFIIVALLILFTHKANITRLKNGNENKFEKLHLIKFGAK